MSHVLIIGPGRLGLNLAAVHHAAGDRVQLLGRSDGHWQEWAQLRQISCWVDASMARPADAACNPGRTSQIWQALNLDSQSTVIFAVPDAQLATCAAAWAQVALDHGTQIHQLVHVSGFHGLEVLQPWRACAKQLLVAHPARPFSPEPDVQALRLVPTTLLDQKSHVAADGGESTAAVTTPPDLGALQVWQADWIHLKPSPPGTQRAAYHAACSLAANHLTALFAEAEAIFAEQMDAAEARRMTASLTLHAIQACQRYGPEEALTGPALRGDQAVLDAHIDALPAECRALYQAQLDSVLRLAARARQSS